MSPDAGCFRVVGRRGGRGGRRVAGEATQVHAGTRAGSVCQTAGEQGGGGGQGNGGEAAFWWVGGRAVQREGRGSAVGFFLLSQTEFGSAHSFSLC